MAQNKGITSNQAYNNDGEEDTFDQIKNMFSVAFTKTAEVGKKAYESTAEYTKKAIVTGKEKYQDENF